MQILGIYSLMIMLVAIFGSVVTNKKAGKLKYRAFWLMVLLLSPVLVYIAMTLVKD